MGEKNVKAHVGHHVLMSKRNRLCKESFWKTPIEGLTQIGCRHPINGRATAYRYRKPRDCVVENL
jgi:hypothetical protein